MSDNLYVQAREFIQLMDEKYPEGWVDFDHVFAEGLENFVNQKVSKLQQFKDYVHKRLDEMGVPADPEPEKNKEHGCRIEGRLNYVQRKLQILKDKEGAWDHGAMDGDL